MKKNRKNLKIRIMQMKMERMVMVMDRKEI